MSSSDPSVRQRKPAPPTEQAEQSEQSEQSDSPPTKPKVSKRVNYDEDDDAWSPYIDALRVLTFLFVASCGLSYLVTSGESWFWTMKNPPTYLRADWWKAKIVRPLGIGTDL